MNDSTHFPRVRTRPLATTSLLAARHETPVRLGRETEVAVPTRQKAGVYLLGGVDLFGAASAALQTNVSQL